MKTELKLLVAVFLAVFVLAGCNKEIFSESPALENAETPDELAFKKNPFRVDVERGGLVFTMDNAPGSNSVLVFNRLPNGHLTGPKKYATHGGGTGGGLGSQGAIVSDGEYLYVCNAGSNDVTVFEIVGKTLKFVDKSSSMGTMPVSVTVHDRIVYVLNAGGAGNISGFHFAYGRLRQILGSTQALSSSSAGPAQISFNQAGDQLVVTEKATNMITTYPVSAGGMTGPGTSYPSAGATPFGFGFSPVGDLIVSEAFGGAENASTVSSYSLGSSGMVNLIEGPVATNQTAACWIDITDDGQFAYTTNTGSASVTGYRIQSDGSLNLLNSDGVTGMVGNGPIDMDMSPNSIFLYVLNAVDNSISILNRRYNGQLFPVATVTDLPDAVVGLAVE